ncbi:hypothetical protein MiYa_04109 [Microcystis aeruginosa NIES-2519]|uniref:Uncharacterized protein n=3 Tax=Microcystis TaxID=1125 RepID=A0A5A5RJP8_MICAE|nr:MULTISPECIES: hypothetical protein [Microcystis]GCA72556.1 hypothetical protein MiYa_04109 [Microcystis aeruginosa NIES-2519]
MNQPYLIKGCLIVFNAYLLNLSMKITYQKVNLKAPKTETAYWRSQSYQTRLSALEEIRQEYHQYKYNAEPRLQRVYTIVKR